MIGYRPYAIVTAPAAQMLGVADAGVEHQESYVDIGGIDRRIIDLAEPAQF